MQLIIFIRLLIELEPSGKMYIYCDPHEKKGIIKLIRKYGIRYPKRFFCEGYNTKFLNYYPEAVCIAMDKGRNIKRLTTVRKVHVQDNIFFFDGTEALFTDKKININDLLNVQKAIPEILH